MSLLVLNKVCREKKPGSVSINRIRQGWTGTANDDPNELFEIFGITPAELLAEEERLFYVAITRARRSIYFLSDRRRESEYLKRLGRKTGRCEPKSLPDLCL